jgi:release factor glutamine methyltransferase
MCINIQTIKDIRTYLTRELVEIYKEPEISSLTNILIKTIFNTTKLHQLWLSDQTVNEEQSCRIISICEELKTGKPVQYILGETIFYDCPIRLSNATLIPRPETEELVDLIIRENKNYRGNIIDIGTGSGCIAIALAKNLPASNITGIDISEEAILIAKENALLNNINASFIRGDILSPGFSMVDKSGIIVSNPPYVRDSEKQLMSRNVLDFEPPSALFVPDSDPLVFYRAVLKFSEIMLLPSGKLYFEINEAMGKPMIQLLESSGYTRIEIIKDINSKERMIKGMKNG